MIRPEDTSRRLEDLLGYPREDLDIELKGWLDLSAEGDKANLAQAILALANHGGGYVLVGFQEAGGRWQPDESRPARPDRYNQDLINGIVKRYAEPAFHCEVHHVSHPESGAPFPIISVPGGHKVPIRAKRDGPNGNHVRVDTYYIRAPGPESRPIQSGREWDDLIQRCILAAREGLLDSIRTILLGLGPATAPMPSEDEPGRKLDNWCEESTKRWKELLARRLADEQPSRYLHGVWTVAYAVTGDFKQRELDELLEVLRRVKGWETGWPPWWVPTRKGIEPYPYNGVIECWLAEKGVFAGPAHSDFWRASPTGNMFLLRGYQEDEPREGHRPGTELEVTLPIWRVGECLLHAQRLASELAGESSSIIFQVAWEGLSDRVLAVWDPMIAPLFDEYRSRQGSVASRIVLSADRISETLPELVAILTKPLYEAFGFFKPSPAMIEQELSKMRRRG